MTDTDKLIAANIASGVIAACGETDPDKAVEKYFVVLEKLKRQIELRSGKAYLTSKEKMGVK